MRIIFIKSNRKYIILAVLFVVFFMFGRHFDQVNSGVDPIIQLRQKEAANAQRGIYDVRQPQQPITIKAPDKYEQGDSARIFLDIETKDDILNQPYERRPMDFSIYLVSDYGEDQLIDSATLAVPTKIALREIRFTSQFDASKIIIRRNDTRTTGDLVVSNIRSFRLNASMSGFDTLLPTILGQTDVSKAVFQTAESFDGGFPLVFTRRQQFFGQIFSANSDRISSVDLALAWRGAGGSGDYLLELREVLDSGAYSDVLAQYFFNQGTINDNLIDQNIYRLPLAANLEKGKKYLISVDNDNVHFNLLNTLAIGSPKTEESGVSPAIMSINDGKGKSVSGMFIKVNGADCAKSGGSCVLNAAIVQDIGGGTGLYTYESIGEPTDFLDLYQYDPKTFFDNLKGGIVDSTKKGASFSYKFDTIYPYKVIKITLNQDVKNAVKNQLSYSFDGQVWVPIEQNEDGNLTVEKTIKPLSNKQTTLFVKVTYDPDNAKYNQSGYFGMRGVKVQAPLRLN